MTPLHQDSSFYVACLLTPCGISFVIETLVLSHLIWAKKTYVVKPTANIFFVLPLFNIVEVWNYYYIIKASF